MINLFLSEKIFILIVRSGISEVAIFSAFENIPKDNSFNLDKNLNIRSKEDENINIFYYTPEKSLRCSRFQTKKLILVP